VKKENRKLKTTFSSLISDWVVETLYYNVFNSGTFHHLEVTWERAILEVIKVVDRLR